MSVMEQSSLSTCEIFSILDSKFLFDDDDDVQVHYKSSKKYVQAAAADLKLPMSMSMNIGSISSSKVVRILSIDAAVDGGILAAVSLARLEKSLMEKSGDPNARLADMFDIAAGSGVGGVLAAMLFTPGPNGRPRFTAQESLRFLLLHLRKNQIRRKIPPAALLPSSSSSSSSSSAAAAAAAAAAGGRGCFRKMFKSSSSAANYTTTTSTNSSYEKMFGDLTMRDAIKPLLIPCYDLVSGSTFMFSKSDAVECEGYNFLMKDVCAATYNNVVNMRSRGGAVVVEMMMRSVDRKTRIRSFGGGDAAMGNPTAAAITHVLNNKRDFPFAQGLDDLLLLSLGSGRIHVATAPAANHPSTTRIAREGAVDMVDQSVAMAFGHNRATNYVRIQANGVNGGGGAEDDPISVAESGISERNVESTLFWAKRVSERTNGEKLDWISSELLQQQQLMLEEERKLGMKTTPPRPSTTTSSISSIILI